MDNPYHVPDEVLAEMSPVLADVVVWGAELTANRTFGGVPCPGIHGEETPEGFEPPIVAVSPHPCPRCGAAL